MAEIEGDIDASYLHIAAEYLRQGKERTYTWMHLQPG